MTETSNSPNSKLGRYELRERMGRGGMATVYRGWDTTLDRWVAVKVMHSHLADDKDFRARFEREAKLIASLNHPNIVQVYDFGMAERVVDGHNEMLYYMVMALIEGDSLRGRMGRQLSLQEIAPILRGACGALGYAHERGMVHRDVTPGNILFTKEGNVVLADFGIARLVGGSRLTQTGTTNGTPIYMSPEQGIGEPGDQRSDVYSLGVILYELLTGKPPYDGDTAFAILMKHVQAPIPAASMANANVSPSLENLLFRALAKEPDTRYPSMAALLQDFEHVLSGVATAETRAPLRTADMPSLAINPPSTVVLPTVAENPPHSTRGLALALAAKPAAGGRGFALAVAALLPVLIIAFLAFTRNRDAEPAALPTVEARVTLAIAPINTRAFSPSMTSGPLEFLDDFGLDRDPRLLWETVTDDPNIYSNIEDGVYRAWHTFPAAAVTRIFDPSHDYGPQYQYQADFTIDTSSQNDAATGIVFRYRNQDQYYVFAINGQGAVSLWRRYAGEWIEMRQLENNTRWTPVEAARAAGQTNTLKVIDDGKNIQAFVNGELVIEVLDTFKPELRSGNIGIYLASTESAAITNPRIEVRIDNFRAFQFKKSS
jgi:tRNA A-37 threonylcarbamoyl transferase component Bud32